MIVVDTHVLIWFVEGDERLGPATRQRIEAMRGQGSILIPAIVGWEIALLVGRGKIALSLDPLTWIELVLAMRGFDLAPLAPAVAVRTADMGWEHRDPADRMIVATAIDHDAPLATADRTILAYAAAGHLRAIDARA